MRWLGTWLRALLSIVVVIGPPDPHESIYAFQQFLKRSDR